MLNALGIYECQSHNPQRNLPASEPKQNPEAEFAERFARVYQDRFIRIHSRTSKRRTLFVREVPVSGNGIADLLVFSWSELPAVEESAFPDLEKLDPTIRAFEFKMSDWRKGLMQAHRYKYFSHASILVLPSHKTKVVESQLETFRRLQVGLWGFSLDTGNITCFYTPRPTQKQTSRHTQKAIRLATQAVGS
jgi:hypothetical protein